MNVFITGATGYIGGTLANHLKQAGHDVRGLVRTQEKADKLSAAGIEPVLGDLESADLLTSEARHADAVISAASSDHRGAVEAMLAGLKGSGKPPQEVIRLRNASMTTSRRSSLLRIQRDRLAMLSTWIS